MVDNEGYRPNVGIIINNHKGDVLWARRIGCNDAWQFPQGGINRGESPEDALYRELNEEVGLKASDIKILDATRDWLKYRLPKHMVRSKQNPVCIGQKQKWFLLELLSDDSAIKLDTTDAIEFDHWQWVSYWYPADQVISFKRNVYRRALKALSPAHSRLQAANASQNLNEY